MRRSMPERDLADEHASPRWNARLFTWTTLVQVPVSFHHPWLVNNSFVTPLPTTSNPNTSYYVNFPCTVFFASSSEHGTSSISSFVAGRLAPVPALDHARATNSDTLIARTPVASDPALLPTLAPQSWCQEAFNGQGRETWSGIPERDSVLITPFMETYPCWHILDVSPLRKCWTRPRSATRFARIT